MNTLSTINERDTGIQQSIKDTCVSTLPRERIKDDDGQWYRNIDNHYKKYYMKSILVRDK